MTVLDNSLLVQMSTNYNSVHLIRPTNASMWKVFIT